MRRLILLTGWSLREPALWKVAFLLFAVLLFSLVGVVGASSTDTPEAAFATTLAHTATVNVRTAYPFLFPLVAVLVTLAIVVQRRSGGLAALQAQGLRRWEILTAHSFAIFLLALVPALLAFLALPLILEPSLASQGQLALLYPLKYWTAMPRLLLALLFIVLFSTAFAILIRNPAIAFGAMVTFFFVGWYLHEPLFPYGGLTPMGAFMWAYEYRYTLLQGLPIQVPEVYLLYLAAAIIAFLLSLLVASRRGEML